MLCWVAKIVLKTGPDQLVQPDTGPSPVHSLLEQHAQLPLSTSLLLLEIIVALLLPKVKYLHFPSLFSTSNAFIKIYKGDLQMLQSEIKEIYKIFNNNNKSNKHQILPKTTTQLKRFYKNGPKLIGKKFNTI